jgi:hypothetical protein
VLASQNHSIIAAAWRTKAPRAHGMSGCRKFEFANNQSSGQAADLPLYSHFAVFLNVQDLTGREGGVYPRCRRLRSLPGLLEPAEDVALGLSHMRVRRRGNPIPDLRMPGPRNRNTDVGHVAAPGRFGAFSGRPASCNPIVRSSAECGRHAPSICGVHGCFSGCADLAATAQSNSYHVLLTSDQETPGTRRSS